MLPSWKDSLPQLLNRSKEGDRIRPPRVCFVGIGSDLRGDDSAGLDVARALIGNEHVKDLANLLIVEGGLAPENQTGRLRAFQPALVVFIDAAQMDEQPGTVRWIPLESIDGMSASSHSLPLSILAKYLTAESGCQVAVLGIQPGQNEIGTELSPPVRAAVDELVTGLAHSFSAWGQ